MHPRWLLTAAVCGSLAVALGAFGAHALKERLSAEALATWQTAVLYHLVHAVVLLVVAVIPADGRAFRVARWSFLAGIVVFSGSLYLLAVTGVRWLGAVTPVGGLAFLTGWAALMFAAPRSSRPGGS